MQAVSDDPFTTRETKEEKAKRLAHYHADIAEQIYVQGNAHVMINDFEMHLALSKMWALLK